MEGKARPPSPSPSASRTDSSRQPQQGSLVGRRGLASAAEEGALPEPQSAGRRLARLAVKAGGANLLAGGGAGQPVAVARLEQKLPAGLLVRHARDDAADRENRAELELSLRSDLTGPSPRSSRAATAAPVRAATCWSQRQQQVWNVVETLESAPSPWPGIQFSLLMNSSNCMRNLTKLVIRDPGRQDRMAW